MGADMTVRGLFDFVYEDLEKRNLMLAIGELSELASNP